MPKSVRTVVFVAAAVAAALATASLPSQAVRDPAAPKAAPNPSPDLSGLPGYATLMKNQDDIDRLIGSGSNQLIRKHSWNLFKLLVLGGRDEPAWAEWSTKCQVLGSVVGCNPPMTPTSPGCTAMQAAASKGSQFSLLMAKVIKREHLLKGLSTPEQALIGRRSSDGVDLNQFAAVLFNPSAVRTITQDIGRSTGAQSADARKASIQAGLERMKDGGLAVTFKQDAIVIKTIWELVPAPSKNRESSDFQVWDPAAPPLLPGSATTLISRGYWASRVKIKIDRSPCRQRDYHSEPIPISCFYSIPISKAEFNNIFNGCDDGLTVPSFVSSGQDNGNRLVLLGFHVMTREGAHWTWQTFYWSKGAFGRENDLGKDNPARHGGNTNDRRWSHYVMRTTLTDDPLPTLARQPQSAFSPYLEGDQNNGLTSNCMSCHRFAVYHGQSQGDYGYALAQNGHSTDPAALDAYFNKDALKTSFLWSLADLNEQATHDLSPVNLRTRFQQLEMNR